MSPVAVREHVSLPSLVFATAFAIAVLLYVVRVDGNVSPSALAVAVAGVAYFFVTSLHAVREHDLFDLSRAAVFAALVGIWWYSLDEPSVVIPLFFALAVFAVLVEVYNYANGTNYLHVEH